VDSAPGRGTEIRIYLPVAAVCAAPVPDARPRPEGGSETILLVEDEAEVRRFAAGALRQFGYLVLEASRGEEALHIAAQPGRAIDLLVSDVMMPGMKGPELAARMKVVQRGTRILFMSGYPDTEALHASAPGMRFTYLQKPFGPEVLAAKVREALGNGSNGGRVLVVDDEEVVRDLFRDVLESAGYEVGQASNGREALAEARAQRFDLVLTDLVMPEQEGIETIRELRAQFPGLKIVAVSGAFEGRLLKVGQKMGADAALAKPVSPEDLLTCVQGLLKHQPV
jgi:CheY-like chemotaxis protein